MEKCKEIQLNLTYSASGETDREMENGKEPQQTRLNIYIERLFYGGGGL